jgi:hypothetical protein
MDSSIFAFRKAIDFSPSAKAVSGATLSPMPEEKEPHGLLLSGQPGFRPSQLIAGNGGALARTAPQALKDLWD